jgi:hypothetical protein
MIRVVLLSFAVFVAAAGAGVAGADRLNIAVSPIYSTAPSVVRVRIRVEPNPENRVLEIIADSEDFYRRSDVQLDGDQAPTTFQLEFPDVPGGEYEVKAVLIDSAGKTCATSHAQATVIAPGKDMKEP